MQLNPHEGLSYYLAIGRATCRRTCGSAARRIHHDARAKETVGTRQQELKALAVIGNRLFISDEVKKIDVFNRWRNAVHQFEKDLNSPAFAASVGGILADITAYAKNIVK
jgi:hypothetical protein